MAKRTSDKQPPSPSGSAPRRRKGSRARALEWKTKSVGDALHIVLHAVKPVRDAVHVPLISSCGRVIARDVRSPLTLPPEHRSERDGFALRSPDVKLASGRRGIKLALAGEATAGAPFAGRLRAGQCVRIATGAILPDGGDAVVMFEDCEVLDDAALFRAPVKPWAWVARAGSDVDSGQTLVRSGDAISPAQIAMLGACGIAEVPVLRKPSALVFTTGNEVRKPGSPLRTGEVYDGNSFALAALLESCGIEVHVRATVRDTLAAMTAVLRKECARHDLIVFTGGTSVGDKDFGRRALDDAGTTLIHGVDLKPGKPFLFGAARACLVFGLPGFPTSALMVAYAFLAPAARMLAGYGDAMEPWYDAPLAEAFEGEAKRHSMIPVRFDDEGRLTSTFKGSAALSSIGMADGYVEIPAGVISVSEGTNMPVRLM